MDHCERICGQLTIEISCIERGIVTLDLLNCSDISLVYFPFTRVCNTQDVVSVSAAKAQSVMVRLFEFMFMQCMFRHTLI